MRQAMRWVLAGTAMAALCGCEPARVVIDVHSPARVTETVEATVPAADADLCRMFVTRVLGPDAHWDVRQTKVGDLVRLEMSQVHRLDPQHPGEVQVSSAVTGPLWLRRALTLKRANPFARAELEPYLQRVVGEDWTVNLFVRMPGTVNADEVTNNGKATGEWAVWTLRTADLAQRPEKNKELSVVSRTWRRGLIALVVLLLAGALYVFWPYLWSLAMPPPEVRARRAARREARRAAAERRAAERAEANQRKAEAKAAAAHGKAAKDAVAAQRKAEKEAKAAARQAAKDAASSRRKRGRGTADAEEVAAPTDEAVTVADTDGLAAEAVEPVVTPVSAEAAEADAAAADQTPDAADTASEAAVDAAPAVSAAEPEPVPEPGLRQRRRSFWWPKRRRR